MAANGPPQEGLDPKLRVLTDLAPAEEGDEAASEIGIATTTTTATAFPNDDDGGGGDPVSNPVSSTTTNLPQEEQQLEQPPQVGQDPKLSACVNDGGEQQQSAPRENHDETDPSASSSSGPVHDPIPVTTMAESNNNGEQQAVVEENVDSEALPVPPPSPTKATVAATMLAISHENGSVPPPPLAATNTETPTEQEELVEQQQPPVKEEDPPPTKAPTTSSAPQANSNPNLTSSESLAEWNRIHANTGPNYNFFQKSQESAKKMAADQEGVAAAAAPKIEELVESSRARSAAAPQTMRPFFTLNSKGEATVDPTVIHLPQQPETNDAMQHQEDSDKLSAAAAPQPPALPPHPLSDPPPPHATMMVEDPSKTTNTNFWLQEEEERFLLGLRLYGWGQWKRIQTIVQTRTNKQIKSHAQKREKVNPDIKYKYGKGKSRRGRISSKVLADDARAMAVVASGGSTYGDVATAILSNDTSIPTLDQAWKDVYGTNNGDGPNSRTRRYRQHQHRHDFASTGSLRPQQLALLELGKLQQQQPAAPAPAVAVGAVKPEEAGAAAAPQSLHDSLANPLYKQPITSTMDHYNQQMEASRLAAAAAAAGTSPTDVPVLHHPNAPRGPPPLAYAPPTMAHHRLPPPPHMAIHHHHYASTAVPLPGHLPALPTATVPGADVNHAEAAAAAATNNPVTSSPSKYSDTTSLRPGMRIFSRTKIFPPTAKKTWSPGTIYSAKVDPTKLSEESVPLIYHIQYEDGKEDQNVPEADVMSKSFYEEALHEIEWFHALPHQAEYANSNLHPLDGGTPVYCQWMDMLVPELHGRWVPGTIHSRKQLESGGYTYHILFDNDQEEEQQDVPQQYVLDRTEYHKLMQIKYQMPENQSIRPIEELYNLFIRKEGDDNKEAVSNVNEQQPPPPPAPPADSEEGQGTNIDGNSEHQTGQLDLLFTASQIATEQQQTNKRESTTTTTDHEDSSNKRQKMTMEQQQQQQTEQV